MPAPKGTGRYAQPSFGQAAHIIRKFGGESKLASLIGISRIAVYRWNYTPPAGTNGLIPNHRRAEIVRVAREQGVLLTDDDWSLRRIRYNLEDILK